MVGRLLAFWEDLVLGCFRGEMLALGRVISGFNDLGIVGVHASFQGQTVY